MERIAKFLKVSEDNFISSLDGFSKEEAKKIYEDIKLPLRATKYSAGYDFYSPFDFTLNPGETIKIPTGIRAKMREDYALFLLPRSGLGFKYRLQLNNTIGLIDADYFYSDNEGHIFAKITNDSNEGKVISVKKGEAFIQGVFLSYGITEDDEVNSIRNGGFGSTSK
ncbi:MAG: deoxyuridine 5'-triphosphate nucleotidohydrolase [Bacilli bacterium]|nr:deoxyuridine 5'-triphosphate nucleotidohydrolase [Bacilli bacterium]MDY5898834.1 deoxyuridine 5'-triphosphate nucleotidohydrolase [Bacilli bacterium]